MEKEGEDVVSVWKRHKQERALWKACNVEGLRDLVGRYFKVANGMGARAQEEEGAKEVLILLRLIVGYVEDSFRGMVKAHLSLGRMLYVTARVYRQIVAKGFCHEEEQEEGDGEGGGDGEGVNMTFEDDVEGTGMGEGEGKEDVTDQIENEEQLLGLKGEDEEKEEQQESKQLDEKDVDTGMEMEGDFEGEKFDLPDKQDEDEKDDGEQEGEEELERELGEGGNENEQVVDEKMWDEDDDDD